MRTIYALVDPNYAQRVSAGHKRTVSEGRHHFTSEFASSLWSDAAYRAKNLAARKPLRHSEETRKFLSEHMRRIRANRHWS